VQEFTGEVQTSVDFGSIYAPSWAMKFSELHDRTLVKYSMHLFDSIDIFYVQSRLANLINYHCCHNHIHKEKMYILYNQRDATYTLFFVIISAPTHPHQR
jgi:hypothetical protein